MTKVQDHSYREGDRPGTPVILLSVAGRLEREENRPAVGASKRNLDRILSIMHLERPDAVPFVDAYDYPILNAHAGVAFDALTGDTEPPKSEYVEAANLKRVVAYVDGRRVMIFGNRALLAAERAELNILMHGLHPSSLNRIPDAQVAGDDKDQRMASRYALAANRMLKSLKTTG